MLLLASLALAAPTVEEQALQAALLGRSGDAIRLLERDGTPESRWIAGRYALLVRDPSVARYFSGDSLRDAWGRIDRLAAGGHTAEAARLALAQMDAALTGVHRDAIGKMLVDWAAARAPSDPGNAARFLTAALGLGLSREVERQAEEALLRLPESWKLAATLPAARKRLAENPDDAPAGLRVALAMLDRPTVAAPLLRRVVTRLDRDLAYALAKALVDPEPKGFSARGLPDPLVIVLLDTLGTGFPTDEPIARLRLELASAVAGRDPVRGLAALEALEAIPVVAGEAAEARADHTTDPTRRRALWTAIAERLGPGSRGDHARAEADEAAIEAVRALSGGARHEAAAREITRPSLAGNAELQWMALADGPGRTAALWRLLESFPSRHACDELAGRLLTDGADRDAALRFTRSCSPLDGRAEVLGAHADGTAALRVTPGAGRLLVDVGGADALQVTQHRVDPEALLRGTTGHPLDARLDAFLLTPDKQWRLPLPGERARTVTIQPQGADALVALTVRGGDERATALVVADPLDVQLTRLGNDLAIGVTRGGVPLAADVVVEDGAGGLHRARTTRDGTVILGGIEGTVRVLARQGRGIGYATVGEAYAGTPPGATWSMTPWQRAVPEEGGWLDVEVFGSTPAGAAGGAATVRSQSREGRLLQEVSVPLTEGAGHARVFAQGDGQVELWVDGAQQTFESIKCAEDARPAVRVHFTPARPTPGQKVTLYVTPVEPLGAGGYAGVLRVKTPWGDTSQDLTVGPEGLALPLDLSPAFPSDRITATFTLADGRVAGSDLPIVGLAGAGTLTGVPTLVATGVKVPLHAPEGDWVSARSGSRTVWARPGEALVLPEAGTWELCAWRDGCGPEVSVVATDKVFGVDGRWSGAPVLVTEAAEHLESARFVHDGERISGVDAPVGIREQWRMVADPEVPALPVHGPETPEIRVDGRLTRGETTKLRVGDGLPAGARLWVFLRESLYGGRGRTIGVAGPWSGTSGILGDPWAAGTIAGETIASGLLEEEERVAEATRVERVDFGFSPAAEVGGGASGYGSGGGSFGSRGEGGIGTVGGDPIILGAMNRRKLPGDPGVLAALEGVAPGELTFTVPGWIEGAELEVVARLPDGRWASRGAYVEVEGGPLAARPEPSIAAPEAWDGSLATLLPLASSLPADARAHALAALSAAGFSEANPAFEATRALGPVGAERTLAEHLLGYRAANPGSQEAIPDLRHAERAAAALALAGSDPERARAAATRLLKTPDLAPWSRARAGLALWVAGAEADARAALVGDDPAVAAARAVVTGAPEPRLASAWWATARTEAADPADRALAIDALARLHPKSPVTPAVLSTASAPLPVAVEAPLAEWRGETFSRGTWREGAFVHAPDSSLTMDTVPRGRAVPLWVTVPPSPVPTRLACPSGPSVRADEPWITLAASPAERMVECVARPLAEGTSVLPVRWHAPDGAVLAASSVSVKVGPPRDSALGDPLSPGERRDLATRLVTSGTDVAAAIATLEALAREVELPPDVIQAVSRTALDGRRGGNPSAFVDAFLAWREHAPQGNLDLPTASALAHAYADTGDAARALTAARVVLDARFKEELAAVSAVDGLPLTSLKLLRELVERYPDGPTVVSARYLTPSMLLRLASGDGDRLGYTRSSLRHTAAAELAGWLLLHPDAPEAPQAAVLLSETLHSLGDPERERALASPLARRYATGDGAWRLALGEARATLAAGNAAAAVRILDGIGEEASVALDRGKALEVLGRLDEAREAYRKSPTAEAAARLAWLDRSDVTLPPVQVLLPGTPSVVPADLPPGTEVTVSAVRIELEAAMLGSYGQFETSQLAVPGLGATTRRIFQVGADGDVPLPSLLEGAWLVTVSVGGTASKMLVIRTDVEIVLQSRGDGTLVHLVDTHGRAVPGARLWIFGGGGTVTARTDGSGAAWTANDEPGMAVLARVGDRYALTRGDAATLVHPEPPDPGSGELLQENAAAWDQLFHQDATQRVEAAGL